VNPSAHELLDAGSVQLAVGDPRGEHAAAAAQLGAAGEKDVDDLVRFGTGRLDLDSDEELGAEATRLLVGAGGQFGAADAIRKAGIVLDAGTRAGLPAGRVPLAHERAKPLRGRVYAGRQARRPGAYDHDVVELVRGCRRQTRTRGQLGAPASRGQIMLARNALRPRGHGHQIDVVLGSLELCAVGKENERQAAGAQGFRFEQGRQRIAVDVDPAMRHVVPGQEFPCGVGARGAAPTDDGGPDAVHPGVMRRAALPASR
jgi:hypothetical protein